MPETAKPPRRGLDQPGASFISANAQATTRLIHPAIQLPCSTFLPNRSRCCSAIRTAPPPSSSSPSPRRRRCPSTKSNQSDTAPTARLLYIHTAPVRPSSIRHGRLPAPLLVGRPGRHASPPIPVRPPPSPPASRPARNPLIALVAVDDSSGDKEHARSTLRPRSLRICPSRVSLVEVSARAFPDNSLLHDQPLLCID